MSDQQFTSPITTYHNLSYVINSPESQNENEDFEVTTARDFANQNNAKSIETKSDDDFHIDLPFPPPIDPEVLAQDLLNNRRKSSKKMLNEFFIFRKVFVKELKKQNLRPRQTKVSTLASISWHRLSSTKKDEYRRLARETENLFMNEMRRQASESYKIEPNEWRASEPCKIESNESSSSDDSTSPPALTTSHSTNSDNFELSPLQLPTNHEDVFRLLGNQLEPIRRNETNGFYQPAWQTNVAPAVTSSTPQYNCFTPYSYHPQVVVPSQPSVNYYYSRQ